MQLQQFALAHITARMLVKLFTTENTLISDLGK
jgi:hypothetical protein